MAWAKIDDQLPFHPKILKAGNEAVGAWIRALLWCTAHETNGKIPTEVLRQITGERRFKTVSSRLRVHVLLDFEPGSNGGSYSIHNYLEWQPSKEDAEAYRKYISSVRSDAGRKGGFSKAGKQPSKLPRQQTSPVPSRPKEEGLLVAKPEEEKRSSFWPADFFDGIPGREPNT